MLHTRSIRIGLLLLVPSILLAVFGFVWSPLKAMLVPREKTYQVVWTDNDAFSTVFNAAVHQRNRDVHDLSITAKRVVLSTIAQHKEAKKKMPSAMQVFFHFNKPKPSDVLNGEHRFTWSIDNGITLNY